MPVVVIATAVALAAVTPAGEVEIETDGVEVYPYPSLIKKSLFTAPVYTPAIAVAVSPAPTSVMVVI